MKRRNPANKLDDEAVQNDDRVKWNSDAGEDANPLSGIEPSKGLEAVPDITKGEKLSAITFVLRCDLAGDCWLVRAVSRPNG